jgi:uncharacterized protein YjbI with pentapeptide repeats
MGKYEAPVEQETEPSNGTAGEKEPRKRPWRSRLWKWTDFGEKTLWDWLQLLSALAIPVVLAVAGFWFTAWQGERQQAIEDKRAKVERDIEDQRAQDTALQAYLDQMSALMLHNNLRDSEEDSEARRLARARTLTVLGRLDPHRKRTVVRFLYESALIQEGDPIVNLATADLRAADLSLDDLRAADLGEAILRGADLKTADLRDANLRSADLSNADLSNADLSDADLRFAKLVNADLCCNADLSNADLSNAKLRSADLGRAYLSYANLSYADLSHADLSNADLRGAQGVSERDLELQLVKLENTMMPDGSKHD